MNFDTIDKSVPPNLQAVAKGKLQWLSLELGVREDNQHVGSGLGGNNSQLIALMSFHHELVNDNALSVEIDRGLIRWGATWLQQSSKKDIRHELDI